MFKSATDSYCFMVRDRNSVYSLVSVSTTERVLVSIMNTATQYWQCIPAWTNAVVITQPPYIRMGTQILMDGLVLSLGELQLLQV